MLQKQQAPTCKYELFYKTLLWINVLPPTQMSCGCPISGCFNISACCRDEAAECSNQRAELFKIKRKAARAFTINVENQLSLEFKDLRHMHLLSGVHSAHARALISVPQSTDHKTTFCFCFCHWILVIHFALFEHYLRNRVNAQPQTWPIFFINPCRLDSCESSWFC